MTVPTLKDGVHLFISFAENNRGDIRLKVLDQHQNEILDELNTKSSVNVPVKNSEYCTLIWDNSVAWMTAASISYHINVVSDKKAREAELGRAEGKLLAATRLGELDVIAECAAADVSLEAVDANGLTPLLLAIMSRQEPAMSLLVRAGASTGARDRHGNSALHLAALNGATSSTTRLIKVDPNLRDTLNSDGSSPLHLAAFGGHIHVVEALLQVLADATCADVRGSTPLHLAASAGHIDVVRKLLDAGASPLVPDIQEETPMCLAAFAGHTECLRVMLQQVGDDEGDDSRGPDRSVFIGRALCRALAEGHDDCSLLLLDRGALSTVSVSQALCDMPHIKLHQLLLKVCAVGLCKAASRILSIQSEGKPTALLADGGSEALLIVAKRNHSEVLGLLLRNGAVDKPPVGPEDAAGPALLAAIAAQHSSAVLELIGNRVESSAAGEALTAAAAHGDTGLCTVLLSHGVKSSGRDGTPAIHAAASAGHTLTALTLLRHRCSPLVRDGDGSTALQRAIAEGEESTALALLRALEPEEQLELCR